MAYQHEEGLARLILRPGDVERPSARKDVDARWAAARGLADYLRQLYVDAPQGGRRLSFRRVEATFGDLWTPAECPAANVHGGVGDATYDAARTSGAPVEVVEDPTHAAHNGNGATDGPAMPERDLATTRGPRGERLPPNHVRPWFQPSSFMGSFKVEVWAQDKGQQALLALMLEDAFNPTPDWLGGGFRLELPYYCNARADYHLAGGTIAYEGRQAEQNKYVLRYDFEVMLDLRVAKAAPLLIPSLTVSAGGTDPEKVPV